MFRWFRRRRDDDHQPHERLWALKQISERAMGEIETDRANGEHRGIKRVVEHKRVLGFRRRA